MLDIDWCEERGEFGYCSSDKLAYIRRFSSSGNEMNLQVVLQGHEAEVVQVNYFFIYFFFCV